MTRKNAVVRNAVGYLLDRFNSKAPYEKPSEKKPLEDRVQAFAEKYPERVKRLLNAKFDMSPTGIPRNLEMLEAYEELIKGADLINDHNFNGIKIDNTADKQDLNSMLTELKVHYDERIDTLKLFGEYHPEFIIRPSHLVHFLKETISGLYQSTLGKQTHV